MTFTLFIALTVSNLKSPHSSNLYVHVCVCVCVSTVCVCVPITEMVVSYFLRKCTRNGSMDTHQQSQRCSDLFTANCPPIIRRELCIFCEWALLTVLTSMGFPPAVSFLLEFNRRSAGFHNKLRRLSVFALSLQAGPAHYATPGSAIPNRSSLRVCVFVGLRSETF